jgi:hypothetical protein
MSRPHINPARWWFRLALLVSLSGFACAVATGYRLLQDVPKGGHPSADFAGFGVAAALVVAGYVLARLIALARKAFGARRAGRLVYRETGLRVYEEAIIVVRAFSAYELRKDEIEYVQNASRKASKTGSYKTATRGVDGGVRIAHRRRGRPNPLVYWGGAELSFNGIYMKMKQAGYPTRWVDPVKHD